MLKSMTVLLLAALCAGTHAYDNMHFEDVENAAELIEGMLSKYNYKVRRVLCKLLDNIVRVANKNLAEFKRSLTKVKLPTNRPTTSQINEDIATLHELIHGDPNVPQLTKNDFQVISDVIEGEYLNNNPPQDKFGYVSEDATLPSSSDDRHTVDRRRLATCERNQT